MKTFRDFYMTCVADIYISTIAIHCNKATKFRIVSSPISPYYLLTGLYLCQSHASHKNRAVSYLSRFKSPYMMEIFFVIVSISHLQSSVRCAYGKRLILTLLRYVLCDRRSVYVTALRCDRESRFNSFINRFKCSNSIVGYA